MHDYNEDMRWKENMHRPVVNARGRVGFKHRMGYNGENHAACDLKCTHDMDLLTS